MAFLRDSRLRLGATLSLALSLAVAACACATAGDAAPSPRSAPDTRDDPPRAVAEPTTVARTGESSTVVVDAPDTSARRVALSFIEAVRAGDETGIRALSSGIFYRLMSTRVASRPETVDRFVQRILGASHARRLASAEPLASYIDLQRVEVAALPERLLVRSIFEPADRLVHVHSIRAGKNPLLSLLGFRQDGTLVVRTMPRPQVVAF